MDINYNTDVVGAAFPESRAKHPSGTAHTRPMRNGATRINGAIRVAMLLSPREIDRDERQGDALLGEEHAHASRIGDGGA
jgi:hypothetical protein